MLSLPNATYVQSDYQAYKVNSTFSLPDNADSTQLSNQVQ